MMESIIRPLRLYEKQTYENNIIVVFLFHSVKHHIIAAVTVIKGPVHS